MLKFKSDLIIIDLEMAQPSGKIIEVGAVRFSRQNEIELPRFSECVNPKETLSPYIKELTGITQKEVDQANSFDAVMQQFEDWAFSKGKNIVICGWGFDGPYLQEQYKLNNRPYPFRRKSFDIKSMVVFYSCLVQKKFKSDSLSNMLKIWQVTGDPTKHRALPDAYNTALLLRRCIHYQLNLSSLAYNLNALI